MAAPMDLNVPFCEKHVLVQKIQMAAKLGYGTVAINNIQTDLLSKDKKQKTSLLPPEDLKVDEKLILKEGGIRKAPRQLSRLSFTLHETANDHLLNSDQVQQYDLVAVTPTDNKTFLKACKELNIDIITIDFTQKLNYVMKRAPISVAMERKVHFELQYSPALRDDTLRKYFLRNAQQLIFWCKGKNVILTSGCEKAFELRGPHDIANLGLLINLKDPQAKDAVTNSCRAVLCHSESRRVIKSVMKIENCSSLPNEERDWVLSKCSVDVADKGKNSEKDAKNKISVNVVDKGKHDVNDNKEVQKKCSVDVTDKRTNGENDVEEPLSKKAKIS